MFSVGNTLSSYNRVTLQGLQSETGGSGYSCRRRESLVTPVNPTYPILPTGFMYSEIPQFLNVV